jgi:hypothetical protein
MLCGELDASSVIVMKAARAPVATGESDTPMPQVVPAAYAAAVQLLVRPKSLKFAPPRATELMCSGPVPELVSVMI